MKMGLVIEEETYVVLEAVEEKMCSESQWR